MEYRLEYCPIMQAISDRMSNVNKVHGDYTTINARGGNEQKILILVSELYKLLHGKGILSSPTTYEPSNAKILRKITLFLIINTNLHLQHDLKQDPYIEKCLDKCPKLTKCVLMNLIWSLNLEDFFYESVALTPHWMSLELLDAAKSNIEYLDPFDCIDKTQRLIEVLYHQISRLQYITMEDSDRQLILSAFVRTFVHLLQLFIKPSSDKMSSWGKRKLMKYTGHCLRNVLEMTICCLKKFITFPIKKLAKKFILYDFKIQDVHYKNSGSITEDGKYYPMVHKTLTLLNTSLFDACSANIKCITMEIYLYWSEIDDEISVDDSLQTTISTLAYELLELMKTNEEFNDNLQDLLPNFARKPKTLHEKIRDADMETVIKCCSIKNENQKAWFDKLIESNDLLTDCDIKDCLRKNIILVDVDNMKVLLKKTVEVLTQNKLTEEEQEFIKLLVQLALKSLRPLEKQIRTVQGFLITHGVNNILETKSFEEDLLQVFNRTIVMDNYKLQQMLSLVIQNPEKVYCKTIEMCIVNSKQVDMMSSMLISYNTIGDVRFDKMTYEKKDSTENKKLHSENLFLTAFSSTFDDISIEEHDIQNFVKFIENIKGKVINSEKLLKFLVPKIQSALLSSDYDKLLCLLRGLNVLCSDTEISESHAPTLVILAQVLEHCRWSLLNFQNAKVQVVNAAIDVIYNLGKEFFKGKTSADKAIKWLQIKLAVLQPVNKIHFNSLWMIDDSAKELVWKPILNQDQIENKSRREIVLYMCETMTLMVPSEAQLLKIDDPFIISGTLSAITLVIEDHRNSESALGFLHHCFKISSALLRNMVPIPDKESNIEIFEKLLDAVIKVPLEARDNCCLALINILTSALNKIIQDKMSDDLESRLQSKILKLDCVQSQGILIKLLSVFREVENQETELINEEISENMEQEVEVNN